MSRRPAPLGDELLLRQSSRGLAVRASALVAVAMLLLVGLVTVVVVRGQSASSTALLRTAAGTADDVGDPPAGTWLSLTGDSGTTVSPGLPADLNGVLVGLRRRASQQVTILQVASTDGDPYRVATVLRTRGTVQVVQVVQGLASERAERVRLLRAMALAGVLALVFALGLGRLLARRAVRPFAQALTLQRAFVADASHELRTPLTLLSTRAQLLDATVQRSRLTEQVKADSSSVVQDVHRLNEVLEDLLVAADPRSQQVVVAVGVDALAQEGVDSALAHAWAAGVDLTYADTDPGQAAGLVVQGAPAALRRAVLALVDNAIDHTPRGGLVTVSCRRDRGSVVLAVSDTGPGVDPAAASDLVRRFHSGGQRAGRAHYGLGLALTHDVANRHGGQLRLAPTSTGATFELVLPAAGRGLTAT